LPALIARYYILTADHNPQLKDDDKEEEEAEQ